MEYSAIKNWSSKHFYMRRCKNCSFGPILMLSLVMKRVSLAKSQEEICRGLIRWQIRPGWHSFLLQPPLQSKRQGQVLHEEVTVWGWIVWGRVDSVVCVFYGTNTSFICFITMSKPGFLTNKETSWWVMTCCLAFWLVKNTGCIARRESVFQAKQERS